MHPLIKILNDNKLPTTHDGSLNLSQESAIADYLKERAEWLKKQSWSIQEGEEGNTVVDTFEIDQAFQLEETEEAKCECCGQEWTNHEPDACLGPKPTPQLPKDLDTVWETGNMLKVSMFLSEVANKVNLILDYLRKKEGL